MKRDLLRDIGKYAPSQAIPALVGLVSVSLITKLFPPSDYGYYVLVTATVSLLSTLCRWLGMSIIRFYPGYERDARVSELTGNVVAWLLVTVAVVGTLYVGTVFLIRRAIGIQLYQMMLIGAAVFVLTVTFEVLQHFLRARRWAGWYSAFSIWKATVGLGIGVSLVVVFGCGIEGLLWGSVLSMTLALPLLWKLAIGGFPRILGFSVKLAKEMAKYSLPLVVGNLAAWVLSLSDRYILGLFRSAHEVGIYSVNYAVSEKTILLLASLFMLASGPISIHVWEKEGEEKARDFISSVTRYYLLLCLPVVVELSALARPIMEVMAGAAYREGFRIMPFVVLSGLFLGLQQRFQAGFIFYKKTHTIVVAIVAAGIVNVGLNLLLVPRYGYIAAAVTTLIGYTALLVIMVVTSRKLFVWSFPFKSLGRAVLASTAMAAAIYPLGNSLTSSPLLNLAVAIPSGALVYFALLFLLKEIQPNERRALKQLVGRCMPRRITPASWKRML